VKLIQSLPCLAIVLATLSGCAVNMQVPVKDPVHSTVAYQKNGAPLQPVGLSVEDAREGKNKEQVLTGLIPMNMTYQDKPFDAVSWIAGQTAREMTARGLPVNVAPAGHPGTKLSFKRISIENHRANGFAPFVTFTSLRADVDTPQGVQRLTAYVKRAKVPVWSFDEVIDPTFNAPLDVLTKELAAKLNQQLFKQSVDDAQVKALIEKINRDIALDTAWLDVYQLGFSNNPLAIPELVKLSSNQSEYVRLAALSSLGILKATAQMPFLIERYESRTGIWQDRAMALKAIGDMGTPESRAYLEKQMERFKSGEDKESRWTREIIALYL
jgi:hypothetical protein